MKKSVLFIIVVLAAMLFGVVAGASAESKGEYFEMIDDALYRIEKSMSLGDNTRVQNDLKTLRSAVYGAARFMTKNGDYDARLLNVVSLATRATEMSKDEDIIWYLNAARRLAYEILIGRDFRFYEEAQHS